MKRMHASLVVLALSAAVLAIAGCGGSSSPTSPKSPGGGGGTQVTISNFTYSSLTVAKGTTVTWKNEDQMTHTATADDASAFQFDTGDIAPGTTSIGITFTEAGTFPYHCKYHAGMHGTITVQ